MEQKSVPNVVENTEPPPSDALPVEPGRTTRRRQVKPVSPHPIDDMFPGTLNDGAPGFTPGRNGSASESPTSASSPAPSKPSTQQWREPRTVREFASQTSRVATSVLRGNIDLEVARVYSGLARTVAQAMSTEVSRARFLAEEPDLSLEEDDASEAGTDLVP